MKGIHIVDIRLLTSIWWHANSAQDRTPLPQILHTSCLNNFWDLKIDKLLKMNQSMFWNWVNITFQIFVNNILEIFLGFLSGTFTKSKLSIKQALRKTFIFHSPEMPCPMQLIVNEQFFFGAYFVSMQNTITVWC